jgi:hypothetical protein
LERDLTPAEGFTDYFRFNTDDQVVRPLADARTLTRPWFVLPRARSAVLLAFCAVGPLELHDFSQSLRKAAARRDFRALPIHQERIREFVKLLNWRILPLTDVSLEHGITIRAVTPNWLTCPTHSHGSPGTLPVRITPVEVAQLGSPKPGKFTFTFINEELAEKERHGTATPGERERLLVQQHLNTLVERLRLPATSSRGPTVEVVVLDTAPSVKQVIAQAKAAPENTLLNAVAQQVATPGNPVTIDGLGLPGPQRHLAGFQPNLRNQLSATSRISLADHGLFVTGIVHDIAPRARIRLIKVLNDSGVGDIASLFDALHRLLLERERNTRLIINMSLVADLPTADELLADWFPATNADPAALRCSWKMIASLLGQTHLCLSEAIDWLIDQEVLIVAAAGNEGFDPTTRPEPLFPAAYDSVLSVAAVTRADEPAQFSNRGDMRVFGNGIAVFGGEGVAASEAALPVVPKPARSGWRDAVAGIFSAPKIPLAPTSEASNTTGWVWWSGTSFATPVISAIAANILLDPATSRLSALDLMQTVRNLATISEAELETDGPFDSSAIFARQVWQETP